MIKCKINNISYEFQDNLTIMQACSSLKIDIPRFCFHERLSIAGNCRMCLVEVKNSLKPVASCAMPLMNNMEIFTNTLFVKKAREGILEFLLANHPLDCPICDQGSECDLQDQAMVYGTDRGRFYEIKRAVEDKDCGPLIKTLMTRCIHCTRCIRFVTEIAGLNAFGLTGRGGHMEVGTYISNLIHSELSGNIIDLCPVGALTSKPFAFSARAWELNGVDSIDVFDAFGSNIKLDCRGAEVMRVLPRVNDLLNDEWISDKVRFAYDGLKRQRLSTPMVSMNGVLVESTWDKALVAFKEGLRNVYNSKGNVYGFVGNTVDLASIVVLKDFLLSLNNKAVLNNTVKGSFDFRPNYLFNKSLATCEFVDVCLMVGTNLRIDSPVLNAKLRKYFIQNNTLVATIGSTVNLTYDVQHLGNSLETLVSIIEGNHWFCNRIIKAKNPLIILGSSLLDSFESLKYLNLVKKWYEFFKLIHNKVDLSLLNIVPAGASFVGSLDIGFFSTVRDFNILNTESKINFIYALDTLEPLKNKRKNDFIVYQGHHGNVLLNNADIILPGSTFSEKDGFYVNLLGMVQKARFVSRPPGDSREDWKIIVFLLMSVFSLKNLVSIKESINLINLYLINGNLKSKFLYNRLINYTPFIEYNSINSSSVLNLEVPFNSLYKLNKINLYNSVSNYYITDSITEASLTMAKCAEKFVLPMSNYLVN